MIIPREIRKSLKAETWISENLGRRVSTAIDVKFAGYRTGGGEADKPSNLHCKQSGNTQ